MSDETAGLGTSIKQLFSPPVLAALRYLLTAVSPLLAIVGVVSLSPQKIDHIVTIAQQLGTASAAIAAFLGITIPIAAGAYGAIKSTFKANVERIKQDASGPSPNAAEAKRVLISATGDVAKGDEQTKQALIAATIALPEVQTIVTDKKTAEAAPSESVVAAEKVVIAK